MVHFSPKTLDFLFENRMHNSKTWFDEHKEEYHSLVFEPLRDLVEYLTPTALFIDPHLTTEARVDKTISRIRRDTRFSHDKSLYRDNMWFIFRRGKMHGTSVPSLYFEITCDGYSYGSGFYCASTGYMDTMRKLVLKEDPLYLKAQNALEKNPVFHLEGECYKRPHYKEKPEEMRNWLERRNICASADSADFDLLFSDRLAETLRQGLLAVAPLYDFFLHTAQIFEAQDPHSAALFGSERAPEVGQAPGREKQDMW